MLQLSRNYFEFLRLLLGYSSRSGRNLGVALSELLSFRVIFMFRVEQVAGIMLFIGK